MNVSLSGSYQVTPNFWSDPKTGIPYQLWVQTPEYRNDTLTDIKTTPIFVTANGDQPGVLTMLNSVTTLNRQSEQTVVNHLNAQPVYDIFANVQDRDLGSVNRDIQTILANEQKGLPAPDNDPGAGPDPADAGRLLQHRRRPFDLGDRGLPPDGHQLPELGRPRSSCSAPCRWPSAAS